MGLVCVPGCGVVSPGGGPATGQGYLWLVGRLQSSKGWQVFGGSHAGAAAGQKER